MRLRCSVNLKKSREIGHNKLMKKIRVLAFFLSILFIWWNLVSWIISIIPISRRNKEYQFKKFVEMNPVPDCIIVFNSGGWGYTSLYQESDFRTIVLGMQRQLGEWGYKSIVIPYHRVNKKSIFSRINDLREIFNYFNSRSKHLSNEVNEFTREHPDKKVILTGLSMGAFFVDATIKRMKDNPSVFAIKFAVPFYSTHYHSERTIEINNGKDALANSDTGALLKSIVFGFGSWIKAKIIRRPLRFKEAVNIPGHFHSYVWEKPEVRGAVTDFLKKYFPPRAKKA